MSFLPDVVDGSIVEKSEPKPYTPPQTHGNPLENEARLAELNNLGRSKVTEDFSGSPHLNV